MQGFQYRILMIVYAIEEKILVANCISSNKKI